MPDPAGTEAFEAAAGQSPRGFARRLVRRPLALVCLAYLVGLVVIAIAAPLALPYVASERAGNLLQVHQGPSAGHLLGTDSLGRDILERLLVGTRITLLGVVEALVVTIALGVPLGLAAGFLGGWLDRIVVWLADLTFALPAIILIILVLALFPQSMGAAMLTFGIVTAPSLMRVVRSATLPVREELYVAAARVCGLSRRQIMTRHVLPRISGAIVVQVSLLGATALLVQTGLAFLGLVVAAPAPSWGGMVADGVQALELQPWLIWPPGLAIALTVMAFGLLADAVRDTSTEGWSAPAWRPRRVARQVARSGLEQREATPGALLSLQQVTVSFPSPSGGERVIEDVTFDIRAGETVGLVGESGCGKTMTAMAILAMLPGGAAIESGRVRFGEQDLTALSEKEMSAVRGKKIALVSQEPMVSLDPAFKVGSQLAEAIRAHHGVSRRVAKQRVLELLADVRLPDPADVARRYPHELSGGMAQRISIARALAGDPQLLIADEPTTALDVTIQSEILELLRELQRERNMSILLVTHDLGVVADICDRVVVMYAGQVVERGSTAELFYGPLHPYTEALLASNPHNLDVGELLPTIPGLVPSPGAWPSGCHFQLRCRLATLECAEQAIPSFEPGPERETRCLRYDQLLARAQTTGES